MSKPWSTPGVPQRPTSPGILFFFWDDHVSDNHTQSLYSINSIPNPSYSGCAGSVRAHISHHAYIALRGYPKYIHSIHTCPSKLDSQQPHRHHGQCSLTSMRLMKAWDWSTTAALEPNGYGYIYIYIIVVNSSCLLLWILLLYNII